MPPEEEQTLRDRVRPWRCGRCGKRITDVNMTLPTELYQKHECSEHVQTYNALRIVVVERDPSPTTG